MDEQGFNLTDIENHPDYVRSASDGKQMTYDPWMGFDGETESLTPVKVENVLQGVYTLPRAEPQAESQIEPRAAPQATTQAIHQSKPQAKLLPKPQAVSQPKPAPQPDHTRQPHYSYHPNYTRSPYGTARPNQTHHEASTPQQAHTQTSGPVTSWLQGLDEGLRSETASSRVISVEANPTGSNWGIFEFMQNAMGRPPQPVAPPHNRQPEPEPMIVDEDDAGGVQPDTSSPSDQGSLPDYSPESDDDPQRGRSSPDEYVQENVQWRSHSQTHYEQMIRQPPTMPPPSTPPHLTQPGMVQDAAEDVDQRFCAQCGTYLGRAQAPKSTDAIYWQGRDLGPVDQGDAEMCAHCRVGGTPSFVRRFKVC